MYARFVSLFQAALSTSSKACALAACSSLIMACAGNDEASESGDEAVTSGSPFATFDACMASLPGKLPLDVASWTLAFGQLSAGTSILPGSASSTAHVGYSAFMKRSDGSLRLFPQSRLVLRAGATFEISHEHRRGALEAEPARVDAVFTAPDGREVLRAAMTNDPRVGNLDRSLFVTKGTGRLPGADAASTLRLQFEVVFKDGTRKTEAAYPGNQPGRTGAGDPIVIDVESTLSTMACIGSKSTGQTGPLEAGGALTIAYDAHRIGAGHVPVSAQVTFVGKDGKVVAKETLTILSSLEAADVAPRFAGASPPYPVPANAVSATVVFTTDGSTKAASDAGDDNKGFIVEGK